MTREELSDRVIELFPPLAEVKPWNWAETDEGEPGGLHRAPRDLHRPRQRRRGPDGADPEHDQGRRLADRAERLLRPDGLMDDPIVTAVAEQARNN